MLLDKPNEHDCVWYEAKTVDSTCLKKGEVEQLCVICGAKKIKYTSKKAHKYNIFDEFPGDPGYVTRVCTLCKKIVARDPIVSLDDCAENDAVYFGTWAKSLLNKKKAPLIWRVVEKRDGYVFLLLLGDRIILPFDWSKKLTNKWEDCTLRQWLNTEFYDKAFTEEEKKKIALLDPAEDTKITEDRRAGSADRITLPTYGFAIPYHEKRYCINNRIYTKTQREEGKNSIMVDEEGFGLFLSCDIKVPRIQTPIIAIDTDEQRIKEKKYDLYSFEN